MKITEILKDSEYKLELFNKESIENLEKRIITKDSNGGGGLSKANYYATCLVRDKQIKLTPEEIIRQLYLDKLMNEYGYPKSRIQVEYSVHFGREVKRADIIIMDKLQITTP